jgi:hypothetical protein
MNLSTSHKTSYLENSQPWYEAADGSCKIKTPTLVNIGDDKPLHLLFPVDCKEWLSILPSAKNLATINDAVLVVVLFGEISFEQMQLLILKFAAECVLPLWVGKENRDQFNHAVVSLSNVHI